MNIDYTPLIVLVDDESNVLKALRREINLAFHTTIQCFESPLLALDFFNRNEVDVVVSDMRMPGMDGAEFLKHIYTQWPDCERILLTGHSDIDALINAINKGHIHHYLQKPWDTENLRDTLKRCIDFSLVKKHNEILKTGIEQRNQELERLNDRLENLVLQRTEKLKKFYGSTIKTFASLVEARFDKSETHRMVENYCTHIAEQLNLEQDSLFQIKIAASLRNIGKIGFNDELLHTPFASLSTNQKSMYTQHPLLAEAILTVIDPIATASQLIRCHKEKLNGSGYPQFLKGDDIPLGSKIISVVNDFAELCSGQLLARQLTSQEALAWLNEKAGVEYDSEIVHLFSEHLRTKETPENKLLTERCVSAVNLVPGDKLTRDLYNNSGIFVLTKNTVLDAHRIAQLMRIETNLKQHLNIFIQPAEVAKKN